MRVCVDLCSGLGGFSEAFVLHGWKVIRVDNNLRFKDVPFTIILDVTKIDWEWFKEIYLDSKSPDVLLASPPCERFSVASGAFPKKGVQKAMEIVGACFEAVAILHPRWYLIENPRGYLRGIISKPRQTIRYSDFDFDYPSQKPTDLWGNIPLPMVKAMRRPLQPRGRWLLGDLKRSPSERSKIPLGVSKAVLESYERLLELEGSEKQ